MTAYAQEIRMYSWACLIVALTAIYAYRFYKNIKDGNSSGKIKNLILFGIFSICCCYIHYYALVTTCLINLILLIYVVKNYEKDKKSLISFLVLAFIQIILYIPWLIYFMGQLAHVGGGFWIANKFKLVDTFVEVSSFQFRRQLDTDFSFNIGTIISLAAALLMYVYIAFKIYKLKKDKQDIKPMLLAAGTYLGVILIVLAISKIIPILYSRYLLVMTGLYIFALAYILSLEKNKIIYSIICIVILTLGIISNIQNIQINYNSSNNEIYTYIKEEIQEDDILVYSNIGNGGVIAAYFPNNTQYFLNLQNWDIEEAYKAYAPGMKTVYDYSFLDDFKGKIWIIDSENMEFYKEFPKENTKVLKEAKRIDVKYHDYIYNILLLEKY